MPLHPLHSVLQCLRTLAGPPDLTHLSDRQLLLRYARHRDELSFAALVRRHAALVMGVCCRILTCTQDAEDVFQATFLVLARKANSLRWRDSIAGWLFEVAHRLALKSRTEIARRQRHERQTAKTIRVENAGDGSLQELSIVLDEELCNLPERYRLPLLLCYREGQTRDQAARQMGWSLRTLHRRLERGLALLRARLTARDLTLSSVLVSAELAQQTVSAHLSATLLRDTVQTSLAFSLRANAVRLPAVVLAEEGLRSMAFTKGKMTLALLLAIGAIATGAGVWTQRPVDATRAEENIAEWTPEPPPSQPGKNATEKSAEPRADIGALPAGASARLGTSWLRGGRWWRFLPDGKRLVQQRTDDEALVISAVPSGKPLAQIRGADVPGRKEVIGSTMAFTRDGKYLAAVCWEGRCGIWETATGRLVRWLESGPFYSIVECDFSPDGKLLAVGAGTPQGRIEGITVGVYEVVSGKRLFSTPGTNSVFAPDGRSLVTWDGYGSGAMKTARRVDVPSGKELTSFAYQEHFPDSAPRSDGVWFFEVLADNSIRVWDVASAKVKHTFPGPGGGGSKLVYVRHIAGRRELIGVSTQPAEVTCWDLHTGKQLWRNRLADPAYYPSLSADGSTLVTGESTGTVRVWDAATGKERASFRPGLIGHASYEAPVSLDGKRIATHSGGSYSSAVAFWDATTGKLLSDLPGHSAGITAVAYAPDGTRIYTMGKDRTLRTWDAASGRELSRIPTEPATSLAVAPDGKTLFTCGADSGSVRVLDAHTGRLVRQLPVFKKSTIGLFLTADGKRLIAAGTDDLARADLSVRICDAGTGTKQRELDRFDFWLEQLAVTPDGQTIATSHAEQHVLLWDAQGKKIAEQVGHGVRKPSWVTKRQATYQIGSLALSADGRWLAYSDQEQGIVVVDARSGREVGRAKVDVYYQAPSARDDVRDVLAFAPDGKTIAFSGVESTVDIFLIETRTQKVRQRLRGDSSPVQHLVFSLDGSQLLSAGPDGSALIWDLFQHPPAQPMKAEQVAAWWEALADPDAGKAYRTMKEMAAHPAETVTLLQSKLPPIRGVENARLNALLTQLDADDFKDREAASRELIALGDAVESRLRQVLRDEPSLELKRRTEDVLRRIDEGRLRSERAIEVLAMIGDTSARKYLRELADGLTDAARTNDAAQALARLSRTRKGSARP
ncbi:MAG TPA: sigma-70 family RNA polymerase sigma factor [Gemmataceae bacterium]|nr:sigma-70 family RNA polymerase sigma factor [Gemmataceae bacterium]